MLPTAKHQELQYLDLLADCWSFGDRHETRNGVTRSLFGNQIRFNLAKGFPLLTTKRVNFRAVVSELLWMLRGETNIASLHEQDVHIWDKWADEQGNLGPVYGKQWRRWEGYEGHIDQLRHVIDNLRDDPHSRRHVVSAWNPADIPQMALAPCHCLFQFHVAHDRLNCQLYQRSADLFIGVPFNIASYALLTHIVAHMTGLQVGTLIITFGDLHLYEEHSDAAIEQLGREPRALPELRLDIPPEADIDDLTLDMFALEDYNPHPAIPAEVKA